MAILQIILSAVLIAWISADDSCPSATEIAPCTCDGEGLNCMKAKSLDDVRKAFKGKFKYGGVRSVWVQGIPITNIPGDLFGGIKSPQFYIEVNNITSVDMFAFSASKKILQTLSLFGNKLIDVDLSSLPQFERLSVLNLGRNQITSIKDSAFNSQSLQTLILAQNQISHIGTNAFGNLPMLIKLELSLNKLTTLGPMSMASRSHSAGLEINLAANQISSIASGAFFGTTPLSLYLSQNKLTSLPYDPFGDLITKIAQKGGFIELSANPLSCRGCDYSWIVNNKLILRDRFIGFTCTDGKAIHELTKSLIQC